MVNIWMLPTVVLKLCIFSYNALQSLAIIQPVGFELTTKREVWWWITTKSEVWWYKHYDLSVGVNDGFETKDYCLIHFVAYLLF